MSPLEQLSLIWSVFWPIFAEVWWIVLPVFLYGLLSNLWLFYLKLSSMQKMTWSLLEIKVPKEILRTPKAMEQIFASLAAISPNISFFDKWWKGKVVEWASFEMVGFSHGVHIYIRIPSIYRNLMEASIYAQYPGAEIHEVQEDYTSLVPEMLPNQTYDIFGTNFVLAKDDAYPIRTYEYFEDQEEERRLDPLATVTEVMSRLQPGELIWLQILVQPTAEDWKKKADEVVSEIIGEKKNTPSKSGLDSTIDFLSLLVRAPFSPPEFSAPAEKKPDGPKNLIQFLTPIKKDVVKAIEEKTSKIGFKTNFRFIYIDNRASFTRVNVSAIMGSLQQFNTKHMNAIKPDATTITAVKGLFKQRREFIRKRRLFSAYKRRFFGKKSFIMNTEELATLFHFPASVVEAPRFGRVEAKKGEPPSNLPIN